MFYFNVQKGSFISRPNRFIANVELDGKTEVCHVKNTGRCAELLVPGATVWVSGAQNSLRRTKYDLITVDRGGVLVNMDSQAPNRLFAEWAISGGVDGLEEIKAERRYRTSRFDFMLTRRGRPMFVEVKGVTLERDGVALFPDAPTERGVKHIRELMEAKKDGYDAAIFFVIQMKGPERLMPNAETHPAFAQALSEAREAGVEIMARDCVVTPHRVMIDSEIDVEIKL